MSSFPSHFRKKYFTGKADFTRRQAYFTDLPCKSISLRVAHIPMRNPLMGRSFSVHHFILRETVLVFTILPYLS